MSVIALQYVKLGQLQSFIFTVLLLLNSEANSQAKRSSEEEGGNLGPT